MTLREQTFSGVRWTTFSAFGRAGLQLAQITILARLLTPADFGLIAMVIAIMAFLQIFADAGISNAIIHYRDISQNQLSSLYWLNVGVSTSLVLMLAIIGPWAAVWYRQPDLRYLLLLAGLVLMLNALGQQIRVVAQKKLRFSGLTKIELIAAVAGFTSAVCAAFMGAGVYSLFVGSIVTAGVGCLLVWGWLADGWRPQVRLQLKEIRPFLAFGGYMVGNNLANTFNMQVDVLLGGKILGIHAIGAYSVPKDLNLRIAGIINPIVTQVGLPVMAKAQSDPSRLKRIYLQTLRMTSSVTFPIYVTLAIFAPEVVHLVLGKKWAASIPLLPLFACWALVRSTGSQIGSLLMACGRADLSFKWNIVWLGITPPVIWLGSHYGVAGMAVAMTGLVVAGYWPNWYFLVRPLCGAGLGEYALQMFVPLIISIVGGTVGYVCANLFVGDLPRLMTGMILGGLVYIGLSLWFNRIWIEAMKELVAERSIL